MPSVGAALTLSLLCWGLGVSGASSSNSSTQALVIPPSQYFEGNDGPWSSFDIRVGTPEQVVRVLVSTASPESMVVLADLGCSTSAFSGTSVPVNCANSRGVLFNPNTSSTWEEVGIYGINGAGVGLEANLGYSLNAEFALETLALGLNGPSLPNQTVAGIAPPEPFYLGLFGLNSQPVNFSSVGNSTVPSFLTTLKSQGLIPSLSWSYTAGAPYRLKQVYGQLIFSGYDTSRFSTTNSVSFTMAGDVTRDLVVVLQSISYSGTTQATLLSDPINIFIDSTDPNFWLPASVCDAFESAFGLTMDNTTGLYLINSTHHNDLLNSNPSVTFRLSDVNTGGQAVTITLPYNSFDLTASAPLVATNSSYFPLKRAANSTQYTLGRAFLQEAYLSADYERGVFNVSACTWNQGAVSNVVTIPSTDGTGSSTSSGGGGSTSSSSSGLSPGAIAGIVVGAVVFVALVGIIIWLLHRRRELVITYASKEDQHAHDAAFMRESVFNGDSDGNMPFRRPPTSSPSAVPTGSSTIATSGSPLSGRDALAKTDAEMLEANAAGQIHELHGESTNTSQDPVELPGHAVPGRTAAETRATAAERSPTTTSRTTTTAGPSPLRGHERSEEGDEDLLSPMVSTMNTADWNRYMDSGAMRPPSPTTPVDRSSESS